MFYQRRAGATSFAICSYAMACFGHVAMSVGVLKSTALLPRIAPSWRQRLIPMNMT
jgi:hypothetical protein